MNIFWELVIKKILKNVKFNTIVEIGSDEGYNTTQILKLCKVENKKLIAIDPKPTIDFDELKNKNLGFFDYYKDSSLNVLPNLKDYEVILIDGDHNWYTVYNELKMIEKTVKEFPLIFIHDISWPYARRDMYYNPESIPKEFLKKYEKNGIIYNESCLGSRGINNELYNSIEVNTEKNGVLTAVEDFIKESNLDLKFLKLEVFNGLGVLFLNKDNLEFEIAKKLSNCEFIKSIEDIRLKKEQEIIDLINEKNHIIESLEKNIEKLHIQKSDLKLDLEKMNYNVEELIVNFNNLESSYNNVFNELEKIQSTKFYKLLSKFKKV